MAHVSRDFDPPPFIFFSSTYLDSFRQVNKTQQLSLTPYGQLLCSVLVFTLYTDLTVGSGYGGV